MILRAKGRLKLILIIAATLFAIFFWSSSALRTSYLSERRLPDPKNSRIVPYEIKGVFVYLTAAEEQIILALFKGEVVFGISLLLVIGLVVLRQNNTDKPK